MSGGAEVVCRGSLALLPPPPLPFCESYLSLSLMRRDSEYYARQSGAPGPAESPGRRRAPLRDRRAGPAEDCSAGLPETAGRARRSAPTWPLAGRAGPGTARPPPHPPPPREGSCLGTGSIPSPGPGRPARSDRRQRRPWRPPRHGSGPGPGRAAEGRRRGAAARRPLPRRP